ncbi:MAG: sensor histidine kinase [Eubacterium sp.]|jgi:two-component system sensor histidine kinase YesM|nr:sensor histidine kinase [Eubacterium sp.]
MLNSKHKKKISKFYKYIRFRDFALQRKFLAIYIIMLIIPLILFSYYFFSAYISRQQDEALNLIKKVNEQSMWSIEAYINQLKGLTILPLYDYDTLDVLRDKLNSQREDNNNFVPGFPYGPKVDFTAPNSTGFNQGDEDVLATLIAKIMALNKNIYSVFFVSPNGDYVYRMLNNSLILNDTNNYDPIKESWYKNSLSFKGEAVVGDTQRFDQYVESRGTRIYLFPVSRAVNDIFGSQNIGTISIGTDIRYIREIISDSNLMKGERIFIINDSGTIIYDNNENNIAQNIKNQTFDIPGMKNINLQNGINELKIDNKEYEVLSVYSSSIGWSLVRVIPKEVIFKSFNTLRNEFLLIISIIILVALVITIYVTKGITNPLRKLVYTMNLVEKGDLSVRFKVRTRDEVGMLGKSFNRMIKKIDRLVNTVHVTQLRKRETELSALQAQINPHFIYNTLESIRRMAEINDDTDTAKMTYLLGKMLRYSINIQNKIVTVSNEIDHVNQYFELQNFRFGNRFKLVWQIPGEFLGMNIIKLLFQPIVENAFYHGLEVSSGDGIINIRGFRENEFICFEVSDNGVGMTEEQVEGVNEKINDFSFTVDDSKSIGLRNINERIKLHYGYEYGLKIISSSGEGTTVSIMLPGEQQLNSVE